MGPTSWTDSPYVGICIRPRATIRAIVDSDPDPDGRAIKLVLITAVVAAVTNAIRSYDTIRLPLQLPTSQSRWCRLMAHIW